MRAGGEDFRRDAPHLDKLLVEVGHVGVVIRHQNAVGGGFERGPHHGEGMRQLLGFALELLLRAAQFLLRSFAREQDGVGGLERGGTEESLLVVRLH